MKKVTQKIVLTFSAICLIQIFAVVVHKKKRLERERQKKFVKTSFEKNPIPKNKNKYCRKKHLERCQKKKL